MVKIDERNVHTFCCGSKIVVVEAAHLSALVFVLFSEKLPFCIFKGPSVEQFLILVRSFFGH